MRLWKNNRRREGPSWAARLTVWITALILGAAAGWWGGGLALDALAGPHLRLANLAIAGNERVTAGELVAAAGLRAGLPITAVDTGAVRAALTRHPWIREARVVTLPPDSVIVSVTEREPVAVAILDEGRRFVDSDGTAFAAAPSDLALPLLVGVASADPTRSHPLFAQALRLLEAARREELPAPARISVGGRPEAELPAITWSRAGGGELTAVLGGQDPSAGLARLAQAWMADLPELRAATVVDLRFGNQLILRRVGQGEVENEENGRAADAGAGVVSHSRGG